MVDWTLLIALVEGAILLLTYYVIVRSRIRAAQKRQQEKEER